MALAGFLAFLGVSLAVALLTREAIPSAYVFDDPDAGSHMLLQGAGSLLAFAGTVYIIGVRRHKDGWRAAGLRPTSWAWLGVCLLIGVFFVPINASLTDLIYDIAVDDPFAEPTFPGIDTGPAIEVDVGQVVLALIGIAVFVPIGEEVFFRGMLYKWLRTRTGITVAVVVSSAIFSALHLQPVPFLSRFLLGAIMALVYEYSGSLWNAILIHALNNGIVVVLLLVVLDETFVF
jgi:hypothetical protein